jgi:phosphotransferase family enzyme
MSDTSDHEILSDQPNRPPVTRKGNIVYREAGPWTPSIQRFLRHLEKEGFAGAPRVEGSGLDAEGRETLQFVAGDIIHPAPYGEEALRAMARLLRQFHEAALTFAWDEDDNWKDWYGRSMGRKEKIIGHCDLGPWNIVCKEGNPFAFIDFEFAGPIDPFVELAQAAWLCVQFHGSDIMKTVGLPDIKTRARNLRVFADAYGMNSQDRAGLVQTMIDVAIADGAFYADEFHVEQGTKDAAAVWGLAWRLRGADLMRIHRSLLEDAVAG